MLRLTKIVLKRVAEMSQNLFWNEKVNHVTGGHIDKSAGP